MEQHSRLLGALLLGLGLFVAFGIATAFENVVPRYARILGCFGGGALISVVDVTLRRFWGDGDDWKRYLLSSRGPAVSILPGWAMGVLLAFAGLAVVDG